MHFRSCGTGGKNTGTSRQGFMHVFDWIAAKRLIYTSIKTNRMQGLSLHPVFVFICCDDFRNGLVIRPFRNGKIADLDAVI